MLGCITRLASWHLRQLPWEGAAGLCSTAGNPQGWAPVSRGKEEGSLAEGDNYHPEVVEWVSHAGCHGVALYRSQWTLLLLSLVARTPPPSIGPYGCGIPLPQFMG